MSRSPIVTIVAAASLGPLTRAHLIALGTGKSRGVRHDRRQHLGEIEQGGDRLADLA